MRIAVTTSNGEHVDQHFGKATSFAIYDLEDGSMKMVERREVESYCECTDGEPVDPNHVFSHQRFTVVREKMMDCTKLYTVRIGDKPKAHLHDVGIEVHLCSCPVDQIQGCTGHCNQRN